MTMATTDQIDVPQVRQIFNGAQHLHKHQKCLKLIQDLYHQYNSEPKLLDQFKNELRLDILWTLFQEPKSPFTKHVIEFLAKFLKTFSVTQEVPNAANTTGDTTIIDDEMADTDRSDQENREPLDCSQDSLDELGMESLGSESFNKSKREFTETSVRVESTFSDVIIKEQLIRFLKNEKPQIRLNCCILIRKLLAHIEDVDLDVYNELKKVLRDLCRDKDKAIRSAAALALHRFQEDVKDDPVTVALRFHLNNDPDSRVRQSCLLSLNPTEANIESFILSTRDIKDIVRKTAFILIADKFDVKNFKIDKRLEILKNGINERLPEVKKVVELKLIPNWIKSYNGDIIQFLYGLDIQSDPELVERTLYLYFNHLKSISEESSENTGFHKFLDAFRDRFLSENNFLTEEELTVENAFLWFIVAKYCKDNEITVEVPIILTDEDMIETDSQSSGHQDMETMDAIDRVVPDLPHYCHFLKTFVRQLLATEHNETDALEFEFMLNQLLKMGELVEVGDEAQRNILRQTVENMLLNDELFQKIHDYVPLLMKMFSANFDITSLMNTTLEIIDTINSKSIEQDCPPPAPVPSQPAPAPKAVSTEEQLRQYELEYAKLSMKVENLKDVLESTRNDGDEEETNKIEELIRSLTAKMDEVIDKRVECVRAPPPDSQPTAQLSQQSQADTSAQKTLTDNPIVLERCLEIFAGCLRYGNFKSTNPSILTLMERLVMPSIANVDYFRIRTLAVKILGMVCLLSLEVAKKNLLLAVQIYQLDNCIEVREMALMCIFDILCGHGFVCFEQKSIKKSHNKSLANKTLTQSTTDDVVMHSDSEDNDRTIINAEDNEVLCSDSEVENDDEEEEDSLVPYFTEVLENNLRNECDSIKVITAKGIAKLFLLGRMFSPQLLTKLLIQWYDPNTTEEMKQYLGTFLPLYANVQMKPNLKGENAFEECFISTVEMVFDEALNFVNLDNMINFILELISDDCHKNLAKSVANRVLSRTLANGEDDQLCNKYYPRVLTALRLNAMDVHDIKEYKLLIKKIERRISKIKNKTKVTTNRLRTIKVKIEKQTELIKLNADNLSPIEEFGSMSLSQTLSQSLSERSEVEETMIATPTEASVR